MADIDTFEEFLKKKKEEEVTSQNDWSKRKKEWLKSIDTLYNNIDKWLEPFTNQNLISIKRDRTFIVEEDFIGRYTVPRLDIHLGNDIVTLTPKGTFILGSKGRIDVNGRKGAVILIEPDFNKWKISKRQPKHEYWDLTQSSFKDILQEVV